MEQQFKDQHERLMTWEEFMLLLRRYIYSKWSGPRLDPDAVDDALASIYLHLLEKWVHCKGSVNPDGTLNLGRALRRAVDRFLRYYIRAVGQSAPPAHAGGYTEREDPTVMSWMETVDEPTLQNWFDNLDDSGAARARVEGVSRWTVNRRRAVKRHEMLGSWDAYQAMH